MNVEVYSIRGNKVPEPRAIALLARMPPAMWFQIEILGFAQKPVRTLPKLNTVAQRSPNPVLLKCRPCRSLLLEGAGGPSWHHERSFYEAIYL